MVLLKQDGYCGADAWCRHLACGYLHHTVLRHNTCIILLYVTNMTPDIEPRFFSFRFVDLRQSFFQQYFLMFFKLHLFFQFFFLVDLRLPQVGQMGVVMHDGVCGVAFAVLWPSFPQATRARKKTPSLSIPFLLVLVLCGACARPTDEGSLVRGQGGYKQDSYVYFAQGCDACLFADVNEALCVHRQRRTVPSGGWTKPSCAPGRLYKAKTVSP